MAFIMNTLETEDSIEEYKLWLETRPTRKLKSYLTLYNADRKRRTPHYRNLELRIELVNLELHKRTRVL